MAKTNWDRYFQSQMRDAELRTLVEAERAALEIGHRLATLPLVACNDPAARRDPFVMAASKLGQYKGSGFT